MLVSTISTAEKEEDSMKYSIDSGLSRGASGKASEQAKKLDGVGPVNNRSSTD